MADTSRKVKRLRDHLVAEGASCRPSKAGWLVYPADGTSKPIGLHTSPRNPTQALRLLRTEVEAAGHTWPAYL